MLPRPSTVSLRSLRDLGRPYSLGCLAGAAAVGVGTPLVLPARVLEAKSPSKRITIGCIGLGNEGFGHNTQQFLVEPDAQVLAVCNVKAKHRTRAKDAVNAKYGNKDCREYVDFREVLAQGYRRRDDRHAGPLARAPVASGAGGRQGRVL